MSSRHGPQIKDPRKYETLRRHGLSKNKAARIANSGADASVRGGQSPPYEEWSKKELYDKAKDVGIVGRSEMSKDELIVALREH